MHYVMSDLHGCIEEYNEMLDLIRFSEDDFLVIDGDIFDRGPAPLTILIDVIERNNVMFLKGNHEYMALEALEKIFVPENEGIDLSREIPAEASLGFSIWLACGGESTYEQLMEFDAASRRKITDYLKTIPEYAEIEVNGTRYVITHSGLKNFSSDRTLDSYSTEELVWDDVDYEEVYYPDKILVTGHVPTNIAFAGNNGTIVRQNNHLAIDCGCVFGNRLGCVCLETGEEFYVESRVAV